MQQLPGALLVLPLHDAEQQRATLHVNEAVCGLTTARACMMACRT